MPRILLHVLILLAGIVLIPVAHAENSVKEYFYKHNGKKERVTYELFLPDKIDEKKIPIVICVGGLPIIDGKYEQSGTKECFSSAWREFATKHQVAILGVGFLFDEDSWAKRTSYQFSGVWSAQATLEIATELAEEYPLDSKNLYLFGISAGAQFSLRFGQSRPDVVRAVAAHAAGGYDPPLRKISTQFLITVGEQDNQGILRKDMAQEFEQTCLLFDIECQLEIIPDIAHVQTERQNTMSREFFARVLTGMTPTVHLENNSEFNSLTMGATESEFYQIFSKSDVRTYFQEDGQEWVTYLYGPESRDLITFNLKDGVVFNWGLNARALVADHYLLEFSSGGLIYNYPNIFLALRNAMRHLPQDVFLKVTDRQKPVVFLDVITSGIARFANAVQLKVKVKDAATYTHGQYIIKLGDEMNNASPLAIEGVILHEIVHDFLDHLDGGGSNCEMEREVNQLVKSWGYAEAWQEAREQFGARKKGDSPCSDL